VSAKPSSPYKGLNAFEDSDLDALLFFGRERETEIVVANLIASRLTVLYGPSGVGKSSLLGAAVARSLRELPEKPLVIVFSQWSADPAKALSEAIADAAGVANGSLVRAIEEAQAERDVYLVLDQAEEYFLYHADDGGPGSFADSLPQILGVPTRVNVLVSLRDDSLARLDRFTGRIPGLFANTLRLDRLDQQAARAAILRPAERYSQLVGELVTVEPALVDLVLEEVGAGRIEPSLGGVGAVDSAQLEAARIEAPYLQLVMQRLWEEERADGSSTLRVATLERLGGARRIVEEHLESALADLSTEQKFIAALLFNHLVTPSGTKIAHEVSDLAGFAHVPVAKVLPVLAVLADRRILRSVDEGGVQRYEIFHDVLAQPVLAWRVGHEADIELEQERTAARRRQRRLLALLVAGVVLLAVMAGVTVFALTQRDEAQRQADSAEASRTQALRLAQVARAQTARAGREKQRADDERDKAVASAEQASQAQDEAEASQQEAEQQAALADQQAEQAAQSEEEAQAAEQQAQEEATAAEQQEEAANEATAQAQQASQRATARALAEQALTQLPTRPLESLRLAAKAAEREPTPLTERVLRTALTGSRVRAVLPGGGGQVVEASFSRDGRRVLTVADRARVFDARTGALERTFTGGGRLRTASFRSDGGRVMTASFSPDGRSVLTGSSDGSARLWSVAGGPPRLLAGHTRAVEDAAFSADGALAVTAGLDKRARVWRVESGLLVSVLEHEGPVFQAEFSMDGKLVATVSRVARTGRRIARLFDAASGAPVRTFDQAGITAAVFSPDGVHLATTSRIDNTTRIWDLRSLKAVAVLPQPDGDVIGATFSADGEKLATASSGSSVIVWTTATWLKDFTIVGLLNPPTDTAFSPNGRFVAVASRDRTAQIFNGDNGLRLAILSGHDDTVSSVAFGPTGRSLVTASEDGSARVWDPGTEDLLELAGAAGDEGLNRAAISPDGKLAVSAGEDGTARIVDVRRRRQLAVLRIGSPVNDASFSSGGKLFVTASDAGGAQIWHRDGRLARTLPHDGSVLRAIFNPSGRLVATASNEVVRLWRVRDGRLLATLAGHTGAVLDVAFSPNGARVASGADRSDRTARIWKIDGSPVAVLRHRGPVVDVEFSPDGRVLATASGDEMARLWNAETGLLRRTLRGHTAFVNSVDFRPDGKVLATASADGDARTWSVRTGAPLNVFRGHFSAVQHASFSPDGHWIVTAGPRTAGLWDAGTGQFFAPTGLVADPFLRGPAQGPVATAEFTPDGHTIVTASGDGTVRTFSCLACRPLDDLIRLVRQRLAAVERGLSGAERARYLRG
jgi:WD40 repeat protein